MGFFFLCVWWFHPDFANKMYQLFGADNVQFISSAYTSTPTQIFDVNNDNNK